MLVKRKNLVMLVAGILILASQFASAQDRTARYNVRVLGKDVGTLSVSEKINGSDLHIYAITDVEVKIIFTYRIRYVQNSTYRNGELLRSSLQTYKKGKVNSSTELIRQGNGYLLVEEGDTTFVNTHIKYSGSLLYFHEPSGVSELYYEISGKKKPIAQTHSNTYQVVDPRNGRESIYEYKNGVLQRSAIEQKLATIYTERLID